MSAARPLAPGRFISLAEDSGQITAVGDFGLEDACRFIGGLNRSGFALSVSVNAAVAQLNNSLLPVIQRTLSTSGLDPSLLWVEITESALVEAFGTGADALARIRGLGVRVAVDDFGTGYSSLSYLQHFPFDTLKIDNAFIDPLGNDDARSNVLVEAIINMARALQLRVVAEGVETPTQLGELRRLGCSYVQGFLLAEPMTAPELQTLVERQNDDRLAERPISH